MPLTKTWVGIQTVPRPRSAAVSESVVRADQEHRVGRQCPALRAVEWRRDKQIHMVAGPRAAGGMRNVA